ncbi:pyridoxal phosphate-dependent aminotransferase [Actibacterium ureilyticum]|uniref:pyridoxal phosphate-dependent aminotransferase n=1 Tax=Actibacterium ureilyticum TaxID=1590614 RepID=UPI000BAB0723|nr:pyridoxal phosphate-dependent aminotransferase [Actibacterium ureilyticum]
MSHPSQTQFRRADRLASQKVSEILAIGARASALAEQGHRVIVLGAGEPDFPTPPHVIEAAHRAALDGQTTYTPLAGTAEMKAAIIEKFRRENGLNFAPDQVIATAGAKQVIFNAFMATLNPGDEVVIPAPYWTTYSAMVDICGGVPVTVACTASNGFRITPEQLDAAITPRTRWLMLNSPSNPTGAAYGREELLAILDVLKRHPDIWLLSDEIYEHIVYDGFRAESPAGLCPDIRQRTLIVNGVSKAYAMTGWRIGYGAGPAALIAAMTVVQSQSTSNPCSIAQAAAVAALTGPQDILAERRACFQTRRDFVVSSLNKIPGLSCRTPEGAFYTFASCEAILGASTPEGAVLRTDRDFCSWVLETAHVAVVPGAAFGVSPYFRVSYATAQAELDAAMARLAKACDMLEWPT